jgi:uncharacterized protein YggE
VNRVPSRLRLLIPATAVLTLSCASGWWTWMPGGSIAVASSAVTSGLERIDDDEPGIEDLPQMTVSGTARIQKPADEARLSVGVTTEAPEARTALSRNSERMDAVIAALRAAGLTEDEYSTGQFRIRPEYDRRPRNAPEDWKPRIVGYTVSNALDVATSRLELVGELIAAANDAGANDVSITGFALSKPERFRPEVVRDATAIAIADARTLADAAGLELVRILRIDASPAEPRPLIARDAPMAMARMAADAAPPVEAGDVTISATVRIVYEVRAAGG